MAGAGCKFIVRCLMLFSRTSFRNPVLIFQGSFFPRLSITGVAVEKLPYQKMAEKTLRQEALKTTFSIFPDIFYPLNFRCFEKRDFFNSHRRFHVLTGFDRF